jgi:hypothetical protein
MKTCQTTETRMQVHARAFHAVILLFVSLQGRMLKNVGLYLKIPKHMALGLVDMITPEW